MRLIDADALKEKLPPVFIEASCRDCPVVRSHVGLANLINEAPTVDAVPVVRCKECKHHHWEQEPCHGKTVHCCDLPHMRGVETFKEFYCYYGEKGEQNDPKRTAD